VRTLSQPRDRILVLRGGAIGDFILTLPVFAALRQHFSQAHIEVLGYPSVAQLAVAGGLVDGMEAVESPSLAGFFCRHGDLAAAWTAYFKRFSFLISYLYDPDRIFQENVFGACHRELITGRHRPDESENRHAVDVLLEPLTELGITNADREPRLVIAAGVCPPHGGRLNCGPLGENVPGENQRILWPNQDSGAESHQPPAMGQWLAIHPGSGSEAKNWPEFRWHGFLRGVWRETGWKVLLVGGEAERDRLDRLARDAPEERIEMARNLPLVLLARRLRQCAGFVGHDSGITHLAAALGLPGLVIWGPSNARIWRPLSGRMQVLPAPDGLAELTEAEVSNHLAAMLPTQGG
jgi:heptosyltransferase III